MLLKHFKYKIHHTTKSSKQPLTAEQAQNEGVMDAFYIRDPPHNHALSATANGRTDSKRGRLWVISTYENHHTTTPCRQLLTAEQTKNEGVMAAYYIQEVTPKVVANAVRIVIRICKIFFQTGLFIIVNNGFEQFLHTCRCTSRHIKRSDTS